VAEPSEGSAAGLVRSYGRISKDTRRATRSTGRFLYQPDHEDFSLGSSGDLLPCLGSTTCGEGIGSVGGRLVRLTHRHGASSARRVIFAPYVGVTCWELVLWSRLVLSSGTILPLRLAIRGTEIEASGFLGSLDDVRYSVCWAWKVLLLSLSEAPTRYES
jgi:hypothetical protein